VKYSFLISFILIGFFFTSCKKKADNVFLVNEGTVGFDGNGYTDSFTILTSTIREDSLKTDSLSNNLIGVIDDPFFGNYHARSFFQFNLPELGKVISSGTLDSVVLFMQYTSKTAYYGDLNSELSLNVYELNTALSATNAAYSNQNYGYIATPIGSYTGKLKVNDSIKIRDLAKKVTIAPTLAIKLSASFANKLFNATSTDLASQTAFLNLFKGLVIVPNTFPVSGNGAMAAVNMYAAFSKIRIYYNDTMQSDFKVLDDSRRFSQYYVSYQNSEITKQKAAGKKANFDTTFLQSLTGAKTRISIPYLLKIAKNKSISVAKAEIIIRPVAGSYGTTTPLPARLLLLQPHPTTGLNAGIIDALAFEPFYGGAYNATLNGYKFNITRHIQNLFIDYQRYGKDNNNGLFLIIPTDNPIAPSRMAVDTRKKLPNAGIEFKLYYSEL
jgi:hypothetical protein